MTDKKRTAEMEYWIGRSDWSKLFGEDRFKPMSYHVAILSDPRLSPAAVKILARSVICTNDRSRVVGQSKLKISSNYAAVEATGQLDLYLTFEKVNDRRVQVKFKDSSEILKMARRGFPEADLKQAYAIAQHRIWENKAHKKAQAEAKSQKNHLASVTNIDTQSVQHG